MALVRLCDYCLGSLTAGVALTPATRAVDLGLLRHAKNGGTAAVRTIHLCNTHLYRFEREPTYEEAAAFVRRADVAFANQRDLLYPASKEGA